MSTRAALLSAWFDFAENNTEDEVTVIYEESSGPRPPRPYVTLKIIAGPSEKAFDELRPIPADPNKKFDLTGIRQYTVSMKAFGEAAHDILSDLQLCLEAPDSIEFFIRNEDIAVVSRGPVTDISALLETGFETRAVMDVIFNAVVSKVVDPSTIESTEISGTLENADGSDTTVGPFEVPVP
jgi:hypothetical protein